MGNENNFTELVEQAQLGDERSLNRLAELSRQRLRAYVYRITLADDLTEDIVQESMLEMFKFLDKLDRADRFWPWLRRIATNKIYHQYERKQSRKTVPMSGLGYDKAAKDGQEGLAKLVSREWQQIVAAAIGQLKPRHRQVLVLRCYEQLAYSEIAKEMQCSEFAARMLFTRAKRALAKQLSRLGLGKGALLVALALFGKMTAPSQTAATELSVTAVTTKVGLTAALLGIATSKTALLSVTTAGALTIGTLLATSEPDKIIGKTKEKPVIGPHLMRQINQVSKDTEEYWYYFPEGANGPMVMRLMKSDPQAKGLYCVWRQNEQGNYYFDKRKNTIYINNYRMWQSDLTVQRLPADKPKFREFLSRVEGQPAEMEYITRDGDGLLVIARQGKKGNSNRSQIIYHRNVLNEEYFRYDWPAGTKVVDNRDQMHQKGWTYFRVTGEIDGEKVSGAGRIPFVYSASKRYSPWLRLRVADRQIIDAGDGWLFKGLSRPWMGLHTIDTVRRDAAESQVWFETELLPDGNKAQITLTCDRRKLIYTIDMEKDIIEKIVFAGDTEGQLTFDYLQDIDNIGSEFTKPSIRSYQTPQRKSPGMLWLLELFVNE